MTYEVEQKFPVADMAALESKLESLGATIAEPHGEIDLYFAHPGRNFAETDEALRIRRKGASNYITYKGPKIDRTTKTRQEIELPLPPGDDAPEAWVGLLAALGFAAVCFGSWANRYLTSSRSVAKSNKSSPACSNMGFFSCFSFVILRFSWDSL